MKTAMSSKLQSGAAEVVNQKATEPVSSGKYQNKKHRGLVSLLAAVAVLVVAVFVIYTIIADNISIRDNLQKYDQLVAETNALNAKNEQINGYLTDDAALDEYIEEIARDKLDFANPNERIYYVVPAADE